MKIAVLQATHLFYSYTRKDTRTERGRRQSQTGGDNKVDCKMNAYFHHVVIVQAQDVQAVKEALIVPVLFTVVMAKHT